MTREERIKAIKDLFATLGIDFEEVDNYEIRIPCPADIFSDKFFSIRPNQEKIYENDLGCCYGDEEYVSIAVDENGNVNWLIELHDLFEDE